MIRVMVSGKFDPPHDGHIDHIVKASALGDWLLVVTHPDEAIERVKGHCNIPLWARLVLLKGILLYYNLRGDVYVSVDKDGKSIESLKYFRPDIFAKGGDRSRETMPVEEILLAQEIGCRVEYGIGRLLNASSKMEIDKEE